jgi:hypothetical protein
VPRRLTLILALALGLAIPVAAHGQATPNSPVTTPTTTSTATTTAAPTAAGTSSDCPLFTVLHDDRIGSLSLPAGVYSVTINTKSALKCAAASSLFAQFLQDFDGKLSGGWTTNATTATFSRTSPSSQSFTVKRVGASAPSGTSVTPSPIASVCPAVFVLSHDDHIGALAIPAGRYIIDLIAADRMTCDQAASSLASFLQDYDGTLPRPWFVDTETGTFLNGTVNDGFELEPLVGPAPSTTTFKLPGDGTPCPGTFTVQHDDKIGRLVVSKGPYLFVPLANSPLTCAQTVTLIRQFLAAPSNALPSPWLVSTTTGTFRKGKSSRTAFRLKPALS